ncbi:hypothetical protein MPTK1_6g15820 [Marchantia polymorpha subsp. ruderalis]|uniref:UspA domain-containing protein n=2 Tax=Marchantia polymorpha TaxID=3197 RepID=A0A176WB88_MARPO|nr:hypothetical protein AXG93_4295s1490 [Marchantia polymorpha subsp. ruderalis]PTQ37644.1 hypothetical protein MARPO_0056s0094 [Marchantia polymorpha]BBN14960.1 hypothetical protein Mp_6g15820 [Marchantia polymorpha subsp. ruderalis]|eukprot:PTQ37644.1 hypothetical protein MARPO_0056s0094 [Marchantia polymorpha]
MMHARKRMGRGGGAWCGELAAHSPEGEGRVKAARRGSSRKKQLSHQAHQNGWSGERQSLVADSSRGNADLCKRVMVVVDASQESKLALKWALSHVVQPMDVLTLLHVQPPPYLRLSYSSHGSFFNAKAVEEVRRKNEVAGWELANQFKTLVATCRPDVEVEILVVEGDKGPTIVAQAKKLEVSILVIGQRKPSVLWRLLKKKKDSLAEYCINNSDCLTLAVRKKSRRLGGYLINSQWQKNFWLLA